MKHWKTYAVILTLALTGLMCGRAPRDQPEPATENPAIATPLPTEEVVQTVEVSNTETSEPEQQAAGDLIRETDTVEYGRVRNTLDQIRESTPFPFYDGDFVRVTEGGEALMNFGDQIRLRLFNDTETSEVKTEITKDPPTPYVWLYLVAGGFSGQVKEGAEAVFKTPGGAEITVLGTDFFVVYDPGSELTLTGNFTGTVEVESEGTQVSLPASTYVSVPAGQPPGPPMPLPLSLEQFEQQARALLSPVAAATGMGDWLLTMNHEWEADSGTGPRSHLATWSGQFRLDGGDIVGSGTGTVSEQHVCPDQSLAEFDMNGTFDFDIGGELVTEPDSGPVFRLTITGSNLNLDNNAPCASYVDLATPSLQTLILDLPLAEEPIEVNAQDGATSSESLSEEALAGVQSSVPLEVTVASAGKP